MIEPRIYCAPPAQSSLGKITVEFAASLGIVLDEWQAFILELSLRLQPNGKWSAFEAAVNVPRQNGKNEIALVRELAGLFLFGERLIIHSAHEFKTSTEHQRRFEEIVHDSPELLSRVKRTRSGRIDGFKHSHGDESVELKTGQRIRFMTRTKGGGRGHVGDLVVLDEAMILPEAMIGALMPTMSARSIEGNPQLWYFGTAVDQAINDNGVVFARIRDRGKQGFDPSLAYFEWSFAAEHVWDVTQEMAADPEQWKQANPALGIRISEQHVANELRSMDLRTFCVERGGAGDWPALDGTAAVIAREAWTALADGSSSVLDPVALAFDVSPDRSSASIAAAGARVDGLIHLEVIAHERGTGWVVPRLTELVQSHEPVAVLCDGKGPAGSLVPDLERAGIAVEVVTANEHAQACGMLYDLVEQQGLRHLGTTELLNAITGALKRPLGDAWAWSRKNSAIDISPLVAVTLALYGHATREAETEPMVAYG